MEPMTAEQAHEAAKGLTFEDAWAAIMETAATVKKTAEEGVELSKRIDRLTANVDRVTANVGGLNRSLGELIETLIAAKLWEKFEGYPYNLKRAYQRVPLYDEKNVIKTDIDILLSDTEWVMAVEVKRGLDKKEEVDEHIKRMSLIRKYPPAEAKGKKLIGAMAGGVVDPDVKDYAHQAGFFVLELTGESVTLITPPENFKAKEW
jgi:hypothetical protein